MSGGIDSWLPLQKIKVADFTQVIAGPACSMLLADMGAGVIKIEPLTGDFWRQTTRGSAFFNFNRNKRSLAVNLKDPKGLEAVYKMIRQSDVVIENFSPGTMEKLKLGYALQQHGAGIPPGGSEGTLRTADEH